MNNISGNPTKSGNSTRPRFMDVLNCSKNRDNIKDNIEEYTECKKNEIIDKLNNIELFIRKKRKEIRTHIFNKLDDIIYNKCGETTDEFKQPLKNQYENELPILLREFIKKYKVDDYKYEPINEFDDNINEKREKILKDLLYIKEVVKALKFYLENVVNPDSKSKFKKDNSILLEQQFKKDDIKCPKANPQLAEIIKQHKNNNGAMGLPIPPPPPPPPGESPVSNNLPPRPPEKIKSKEKKTIRNTLFGEKISENKVKTVDELIIQLKELYDDKFYYTWALINPKVVRWIVNNKFKDEINKKLQEIKNEKISSGNTDFKITKEHKDKIYNKILIDKNGVITRIKSRIEKEIEAYIEEKEKSRLRSGQGWKSGGFKKTKKYINKGKKSRKKTKTRRNIFKLIQKKTRKK